MDEITEKPKRDELAKYTWENYGDTLFPEEEKFVLTRNEKQIIKVLLYKYRPPKKYRRNLWMISSGAQRELANNPNYYWSLVEYSKKVPSPSASQIEVDLRRTFPNEPKCNTDTFLNQLRNILVCYSIRNSTVGYCQGMNFIVGKLLLELEDEEKVFWVFVQIIESLLPLNYYPELAGLITNSTMMTIMMEKYLPDLYYFFQQNQFELTVSNFIHKWFVCLFTQNFNLNLSAIILDFFFLEGYIILTKACLGVFTILRKKLKGNDDAEIIYTILSERTNDIKNPQLILYFLARRKFEFRSETLAYFRDILQGPIVENLRRAKRKRKNSKSSLNLPKVNGNNHNHRTNQIQCDPKWPFCIDNTNQDNLEVLVLKLHKGPYIIDDYYYKKTSSYQKEKLHDIDGVIFKGDNDILLERRKHCCDDRKLVEASIIMLDNKKPRSSSSENPKNSINTGKSSYYEIAKRGQEFERAKIKLMDEFKPAPILAEEIQEFQ